MKAKFYAWVFCLESDSKSEEDKDKVINIAVTPESIDNLLQQFRNWFTNVDGKHRSERVAFQRSRQILSILKTISLEEYDPTDLFNRLIFRDDWLTKFGNLVRQ